MEPLPCVLFLEAQIKGSSTGGLFSASVVVQGHIHDGLLASSVVRRIAADALADEP